MQARCLNRALPTLAPRSTSGALQRYDNNESTELKDWNRVSLTVGAMERVSCGCGTTTSQALTWTVDLEGDTLAELSQDCQVENDGRGEERVLASVVHHDGVASTEHELADVLVQGAFRVAHIGNVLYHHRVVGMRHTLAIQNLVRVDHIVHNI